MGNENSKDGEGGAEQPDAEGLSGSEKDTESKLPNGDVGTSSGKSDEAPEGPTPEDGGEPKEPSDVDDHTKRMTIISENVYHYVGIVAGRHYAREKGLLPKAGDLPVAPRGFLRPEKKNQDVKANEGKAVSEKPDIDGLLSKETPKEADSPVMELPRFYQPQSEDTNKATEQSGEAPDASDSKAQDKEKSDSEKPAKVESKKEGDVDTAVEMELPRFYQSSTTDKKKAPEESLKPTGVSKSEVKNKTEETGDKERVENREKAPEREIDVHELELPRFNQSDKSKAENESGKSDFPNANNGKTEMEGKNKPDKEVRTPATKIPRFYQSPNEEIKKTGGESGKSDVPNGISESKTQEKRGKVDEIETTNMALPRFYQPPGQDKTRTHEELSDKSETRKVPNGDTKAKTEEKNGKLDNNREKETKDLELPRFYSADITEDRPEGYSDLTSERHTTALTVGPRSRRLEEPKRKTSVKKNSIYVGSTKNEEDKAEEQDVEGKTVQKEEETKLKKEKSLELLEEANDPEPKVTESRSREKKEKIVRFDDLLVEDTTPSTERKRITSMMTIIAPMRNNTKSDDGSTTCYAAPVELTSTPPPTSVAEETRPVNDDDVDYDDDPIPMCGEELLKADRRRRGFNEDEYDIVNTIWDAEEDKTQQQQEEDDIPGMSNQGKDQTMNSQYDAPDANEEIITPMVASSLYSSATIPGRQSSPRRTHDVQEDVPDYDVHHLKQPVPRSPEVDLGSGKILNAPSILMGSSITLSANRQKCETLHGDGPVSSVGVKTTSAPKEVVLEAPKRGVSRATGTASPDDSVDGERASTIGTVYASVEPSVMDPLEGGKNRCDNYTQTSDVAREDEPKGAPPLVRSRSVGFQCGVGEPKRSIAIQKRPSLPSDSRPARPSEVDKKTRIPLATRSPLPQVRSAQTLPRSAHTETRSAHPEPRVAQPEARRGKGSPLPERKISVLRKGTPTNKTSPRTPPATNDSKNQQELAKRSSSLSVQSSSGCVGHPVTPKVGLASPRLVRKKDDSKSHMHKTNSTSKSMDCIPRCTCLQLTGKESPQGDRTTPRSPGNPLGLREYGFAPPSKRPQWR